MIFDLEIYLENRLISHNFKHTLEDADGVEYEADMHITSVSIDNYGKEFLLKMEANGSYFKGDIETSVELSFVDYMDLERLQLEVEELDGQQA